MNYCSLEDAYGIKMADAVAKKEERRKAKRCKGPAATFLDLDPDRQQLTKLPDAPVLNPATGLREHVPVEESQGYEPFQDGGHKVSYIGGKQPRLTVPLGSGIDAEKVTYSKFGIDNISSKLRDEAQVVQDGQAGMYDLPGKDVLQNAAAVVTGGKKNFFGADEEDGFADYRPDAKNYLMEPSTAAFASRAYQNPDEGDGRPSAAKLPIPSVKDFWKPLTPAGADTAYFQALPKPGGTFPKTDGNSHETLSRKIDTIMNRLDEMKRGHTISPDQSQTDVLLFVSSGIFVLFMMDLLVRKGSSLRFLGGL
jgi:hypothetical protein